MQTGRALEIHRGKQDDGFFVFKLTIDRALESLG